MSGLKSTFRRPASESLLEAYWIICSTSDSAKCFYESFKELRNGKRGALAEKEQDLLRAMLTMTAAGIDSSLKHILQNSLSEIMDASESAQKQIKKIVQKKIDHEANRSDFLADSLLSKSPRMFIVQLITNELAGKSLQSSQQIFKICSVFGLETGNISKKYKEKLNSLFKARNKIIHEMDIDFNLAKRSRHQRKEATMVNHCNVLLELGNEIIKQVDNLIQGKH